MPSRDGEFESTRGASRPKLRDIQSAAARIREAAIETPVLESVELSRQIGCRVLFKAESLQRTGSFKIRGAYNKLAQLTDDQRAAGVITWSAGNHAQGIATAASLLGAPATILMPYDAPKMKIARTERLGTEVIFYDRYKEDREALANQLAAERGGHIIPPFDNVDVIAGQGVVGLEFAQQARAVGVELDMLLVPCGGGGLTAGVATAFAALSPTTRIYCVEPIASDDTARSLASGRREKSDLASPSICDALLTKEPGKLTFEINKALLSGGIVVSDEETRMAVKHAYAELKLVVEPGGAVGLAALLSGNAKPDKGAVGVILSGGNIDAALLAEIIS